MKQVKIDEIVVNDEMYERVQKIAEAFNKRHADTPTTVGRMMKFVLNTGLSHNNCVKFKIQKFEMELGLRNEFETDSEYNYL